MRYFLVKYVKKPDGNMDELVSVSRRLRTKDLQFSSVILDFKTQQVVMASMNGVTVPKNWPRIRDFYHQHYKDLIDALESDNAIDTSPAQNQ